MRVGQRVEALSSPNVDGELLSSSSLNRRVVWTDRWHRRMAPHPAVQGETCEASPVSSWNDELFHYDPAAEEHLGESVDVHSFRGDLMKSRSRLNSAVDTLEGLQQRRQETKFSLLSVKLGYL